MQINPPGYRSLSCDLKFRLHRIVHPTLPLALPSRRGNNFIRRPLNPIPQNKTPQPRIQKTDIKVLKHEFREEPYYPGMYVESLSLTLYGTCSSQYPQGMNFGPVMPILDHDRRVLGRHADYHLISYRIRSKEPELSISPLPKQYSDISNPTATMSLILHASYATQ